MSKYDLTFATPLLNAAGSLGFTPDPYGPVELTRFGAFVTNPISFEIRTPARRTRYIPFPGGFLLHTGHPNPGFKTALYRFAPAWSRSALPVIVHLLPTQSLADLTSMVRILESTEGLLAVEIGLPTEVDSTSARELAFAAASSEIPVIVRLPLEHATDLARAVAKTGIAAISLGPPRGMLPAPNGKPVTGRLFGPAMYPLVLAAVRAVAQLGLPVIGAGGIYQTAQIEALLAAGAMAVQVDSALWRGWV